MGLEPPWHTDGVDGARTPWHTEGVGGVRTPPPLLFISKACRNNFRRHGRLCAVIKIQENLKAARPHWGDTAVPTLPVIAGRKVDLQLSPQGPYPLLLASVPHVSLKASFTSSTLKISWVCYKLPESRFR